MLAERQYAGRMHQPAFWTVTTVLIAINLVVYCSQHVAGQAGWDYERFLALQPDLLLQGHAWQLVTFQFLHDTTGPLHIIINLVLLWYFGRQVESFLGRISFLKLYLWSGVAGGLTQVIIAKSFGDPAIALMGASAGVCGVIAAFAAIHWDQKLILWLAFVYPVPTRGKWVILILLGFCVLEWVVGADNVAHAAHFGGIWMGLVYIRWIVQADRVLNAWEAIRSRIKARPLIERVEPPEVPFASVEPAAVAPPPPPPPATVRLQLPPRPVADREDVFDFDNNDDEEEEELLPHEFIEREVDPILDKIAEHGIECLTEREREILEKGREIVMGK